MRTKHRTLSLALAFVIALGVFCCPLFEGRTNAAAYKEYTGIEEIDDFLNDPRWAEGVEWDTTTRAAEIFSMISTRSG